MITTSAAAARSVAAPRRRPVKKLSSQNPTASPSPVKPSPASSVFWTRLPYNRSTSRSTSGASGSSFSIVAVFSSPSRGPPYYRHYPARQLFPIHRPLSVNLARTRRRTAIEHRAAAPPGRSPSRPLFGRTRRPRARPSRSRPRRTSTSAPRTSSRGPLPGPPRSLATSATRFCPRACLAHARGAKTARRPPRRCRPFLRQHRRPRSRPALPYMPSSAFCCRRAVSMFWPPRPVPSPTVPSIDHAASSPPAFLPKRPRCRTTGLWLAPTIQ
mmetsp:Transcript_20259/g.57532  ORF Transcript_20259/g.57532 Transcript_20259/m.57532 type:complete len:271 (+) Transcript_20259:20-832(+)